MDKVSALMDGELDEHEARQVVLGLKDAGAARESWAAYHVIGDVLRGESLPAFDVSGRVAAAVAGEPAILAPRRPARMNRPLTYALSAAASVSAMAVVGWMAFSGNPSTLPLEIARNAPVVQQAPETQLVSTPRWANERLPAGASGRVPRQPPAWRCPVHPHHFHRSGGRTLMRSNRATVRRD